MTFTGKLIHEETTAHANQRLYLIENNTIFVWKG